MSKPKKPLIVNIDRVGRSFIRVGESGRKSPLSESVLTALFDQLADYNTMKIDEKRREVRKFNFLRRR